MKEVRKRSKANSPVDIHDLDLLRTMSLRLKLLNLEKLTQRGLAIGTDLLDLPLDTGPIQKKKDITEDTLLLLLTMDLLDTTMLITETHESPRIMIFLKILLCHESLDREQQSLTEQTIV